MHTGKSYTVGEAHDGAVERLAAPVQAPERGGLRFGDVETTCAGREAIFALTVVSCGGDGESSSSEPDVPPVGGMEVDDDAVRQALRRVCAAAFSYALGGGFGADDGAVEKVELFSAPALAPDVVVIRTRGPAEFGVFPTLDRIEAGNVASTAGGFTDEELVALAASGSDAIDGVMAGTGLDGLEEVGMAAGAEDETRRRCRGVPRRSRDLRRILGRVGGQRRPGGRNGVHREAEHAVSDARCDARIPVAQQRFPTEAKRHTVPRWAPTFRRYTRRSCSRRRAQPHLHHTPRSSPLDTEVK